MSKNKQHTVKLPPLAFGEHKAKLESDMNHYIDTIACAIPGLNYFQADNDAQVFQAKSHLILALLNLAW